MNTRKFNKKNILVATLMSGVGISLVGSIAGTFAWYQYSTRAILSYVGQTDVKTAQLEVKFKDDATHTYNWGKTTLGQADFATYLANNANNTNLLPITAGKLQKNAAFDASALKGHPVAFYDTYDKWADAAATDYIQFDIQLRYLDNKTGEPIANTDIWLSDLLIQNDTSNGHQDVSDAIRVHVSAGTTNWLMSKTGANTKVGGNLDLNNDGEADALSARGSAYEFENKTALIYGEQDYDLEANQQTCYTINNVKPTDNKGTLTGGEVLGTTDTNGILDVTVTFFLEGWTILNGKTVWEDAIGAKFDIGMTFAASILE